jgi:hypothetical protein
MDPSAMQFALGLIKVLCRTTTELVFGYWTYCLFREALRRGSDVSAGYKDAKRSVEVTITQPRRQRRLRRRKERPKEIPSPQESDPAIRDEALTRNTPLRTSGPSSAADDMSQPASTDSERNTDEKESPAICEDGLGHQNL